MNSPTKIGGIIQKPAIHGLMLFFSLIIVSNSAFAGIEFWDSYSHQSSNTDWKAWGDSEVRGRITDAPSGTMVVCYDDGGDGTYDLCYGWMNPPLLCPLCDSDMT